MKFSYKDYKFEQTSIDMFDVYLDGHIISCWKSQKGFESLGHFKLECFRFLESEGEIKKMGMIN
jgi:hypothetical protein